MVAQSQELALFFTSAESSPDRWWLALVVAATAAAASYAATWLFKRRDVERELALRCLSLIDEASDTIRLGDEEYEAAGGGSTVKSLLRGARTGVRPLRDSELDYRVLVAERFAMDTYGWRVPRVWLEESIENVRLGLFGYLAPPRFAPWRKSASNAPRSFPPYDAYEAAAIEDPYSIFDWLGTWMSEYERRRRSVRARRVARWLRKRFGRRRSPYEAP